MYSTWRKTGQNDGKRLQNLFYKYLIYSQYVLTNGEIGYWRLVLIGVNLYHSYTSPEGSHGSTSFQQRVESRQPFDEIKHRHTLKEVGDVAEGRYDWKIERGRGGVTL